MQMRIIIMKPNTESPTLMIDDLITASTDAV